MTRQDLIDPATHIGTVSLTVANLERSLRFYGAVLGLAASQRDDTNALLAVDGRPLLHLVELPGARPKAPRATGLYHFAVLLPDRCRRAAPTR